MEQKPIIVLGVEITKINFPNLFPIAENNPVGFAKQLKGWVETTGAENATSAAICLEHDLEHERLAALHPLTEENIAELAEFFDDLARFDYEDAQKDGRVQDSKPKQ